MTSALEPGDDFETKIHKSNQTAPHGWKGFITNPIINHVSSVDI